MPLLEIIENKAHPALQPKPNEPQIEYDSLMDEFDAAQAFGEAYWNSDRDRRAAMVGHYKARQILRLMIAHDTKPKKKRK